ncbi:MAG TPA: hypothetical protein VIZ22_13020 [Candidatus Limnocylindrales bacterium]
MSPRIRREPFAADHERARELAAQRVDGPVAPDDAGWLNDHLAWCGPCRAVAAEYDEQRLALRALRHDPPTPPRDLWARTAAAIEAEPARRRPTAAGRRRTRLVGFAPLVAALVVAVALGGSFLDGVLPPLGSTTKGDDPEATPIDLVAGEIQVLSHADDGSLELLSRNLDQLCPVAAESCGLSNVLDVTHVASIGSNGELDAIVSPDRGQLVVVESGKGSSSIFVVPLKKHQALNPTPGSGTSTASHQPASDDPGTTATVDPADTASPDTTDEPGSDDPGESPDASDAPPSDTPPSDAAGSPPASSEPTDDPGASDEPVTTPDPTDEPEPEPTPKATEPAPTVEVTPGPDGAIEIARNVVLVGSAAGYSPDGSRFAFSARPAKGSAGPDVFVWRVGDRLAKAVTTDHGSQLAGWIGDRLLVSRVVDGKPRTSILDLDDGSERHVGDGAMWRPTVGPGRELATWWDGTVKQADDGITWVPDRGRLVLANWPDGSDSQVLAEGAVTDWDVAWDETGTKLAVWVSRDDPGKPGKLSLYTVDEATGRPDLARPPLDGAPAYAGFALEPGRLAWSSPAAGGDTSVVVLGWSGNNFGKVTLPTENGATVLR